MSNLQSATLAFILKSVNQRGGAIIVIYQILVHCSSTKITKKYTKIWYIEQSSSRPLTRLAARTKKKPLGQKSRQDEKRET
jgi:hypothetical protein